MREKKILFATRAFSSPQIEGGFLLLRDIAIAASNQEGFSPYFFTSKYNKESLGTINGIEVFRRPGWNNFIAARFLKALITFQKKFDIVHTAHVPTNLNACLLNLIRKVGTKTGVRYVQTITALPASKHIHKDLFWGDKIVCLHDDAADIVAQHHSDVRVIEPAPNPQRLANRKKMPDDIKRQLRHAKVITFPIVLYRLEEQFDLCELALRLLSSLEDVILVFVCRFEEHVVLSKWLKEIVSTFPQRVLIFGTINWILDLFNTSHVVVYPIHNLTKKFNPPLVLLEAANLNAKIITTSSVKLSKNLENSACIQLTDDDSQLWFDAIVFSLNQGVNENNDPKNQFELCYNRYLSLYKELL